MRDLPRLGLAIVLLAAGGYACFRSFTDTIVRFNPPAVLIMGDASSPNGQGSFAQVALARGRLPQAIEAARQSLADRPLDAATLRTLGLAQMQSGALDGAAQTLTLASQLGWRDAETQKLLLSLSLQSDDLSAAAIRFDALARQRIDLDNTIPTGLAIVSRPGAPMALAERLAEAPAWRASFMKATDLLPAEAYPAWLELMKALARLHASVHADEIAAFERTLIAKAKPALAITASRQFGTLRRPPPPGFGQVAQGADISPFVWAVAQGREGAVMQPASGAISATTDGQTTGAFFSRVFALPPGRHVLAMREQADAGDADAFVWQVDCLPSGTSLLPRDRPRPRDGVRALAFAVSASCPAVRITLAGQPGQLPGSYAATWSDLRLD